MPIHTVATQYVVEIQHRKDREGMLCVEGLEVRVCDEGAGPFLAIKGRNLEPSDDYDSHTVTLEMNEIQPLCDALKTILEQAEDAAK